jgi:hypothetical protein
VFRRVSCISAHTCLLGYRDENEDCWLASRSATQYQLARGSHHTGLSSSQTAYKAYQRWLPSDAFNSCTFNSCTIRCDSITSVRPDTRWTSYTLALEFNLFASCRSIGRLSPSLSMVAVVNEGKAPRYCMSQLFRIIHLFYTRT